MLHAARPRGPKRGHRGESRTGKQRERFETETRTGSAPVSRACRDVVMPRRHGPRRCRVVASARDCRPAYNRPTVPLAHERTRRPAPACFTQLAAT